MQSSNIQNEICTSYRSTHSKGGEDVIMSKFDTPKYTIKMGTKYRVHMCEQS